MVRQWQTLFYGKRYSQTVLQDKVDFCKVAEGLGCEAIRVTKKEEVAPALEKAIKKAVGGILESIGLFDVYEGSQIPEGMKSVAFNLTLRSAERTLTDDEADGAVKRAIAALEKLGVHLRS